MLSISSFLWLGTSDGSERDLKKKKKAFLILQKQS